MVVSSPVRLNGAGRRRVYSSLIPLPPHLDRKIVWHPRSEMSVALLLLLFAVSQNVVVHSAAVTSDQRYEDSIPNRLQ